MHQRCFLVGLCCAAEFSTGTAAIMTSRGDYLGLYVLQKRRLVRSFNWPWLERGRAGAENWELVASGEKM